MSEQSPEIVAAILAGAQIVAKSGAYSDWTMVAATIAAAIAAFFSARAAIKGPQKVAEEAEKIRVANERRQLKFEIFSQILSTRSLLWVQPTALTLNKIDVVFDDSQPVRDAWSKLHRLICDRIDPSDQSRVAIYEVEEKKMISDLLRAMARDLDLSSSLTEDALAREYLSDIMFAMLYSQALQAYEALGFSREEARARMGLKLPVPN